MIFYGARLVLARQSRGLSRKDLADALGVPVVQVRRWERNEAQPRVSILTPLDEYGALLTALAYPASFFRTPPSEFPALNQTSLQWHGAAYDCDRCDEPIDGMLIDNPNALEHYHPGCKPKPRVEVPR